MTHPLAALLPRFILEAMVAADYSATAPDDPLESPRMPEGLDPLGVALWAALDAAGVTYDDLRAAEAREGRPESSPDADFQAPTGATLAWALSRYIPPAPRGADYRRHAVLAWAANDFAAAWDVLQTVTPATLRAKLGLG